MPTSERPGVLPPPGESRRDHAGQPPPAFRPMLRLHAYDLKVYVGCEYLTEALTYFMVVFSPWAFGTTQEWSIWVMNGCGYGLGLLLAVKLGIRWFKGYRPARWGTEGTRHGFSILSAASLRVALAVLTVAILGYCLISAVNTRSTYKPFELSFEYRDFIAWLPHSFDGPRSWFAFWNFLGLACSFWALCDWLQGKSSGEQRADYLKAPGVHESGSFFPARLRRLLWLLSVNGALLGLEAIAQRIEGSGKLLWLVQPRVNPGAETQFGPYAYRSNAAQYFNLLWPVCLGFWWTLKRSGRRRDSSLHALLIGGALMAACPIISTSRGGALVSVGIVVAAGAFLLATQFFLSSGNGQDKEARNATAAALGLFFAGALVIGFALGWTGLGPRMSEFGLGLDNREAIYAMARPMAEDYPVFGTGPGTFEHLFQFYRPSVYDYWPAQLHNDWLETLITFGWAGCSLVALALATVLLRWFAPGGIHGGRRFVMLVWMALAGCLVHARFDFPFQIYSIVFLFLVLCAILFGVTRSPLVRK